MAETQKRPFLNVSRSVSGRRWQSRLAPEDEREALAICQQLGVSDIVARIVAARGVRLADAEQFLAPSLRTMMPDPSVLQDLDRAVARIATAIKGRERIALFGDYDVDGAVSVALFAKYLQALGLEPLFHIPDRIAEGYGPNTDAVGALASEGATLLITLDCGSTSHEVLRFAAGEGLDVIVIDHHQVGEALPEAFSVVNPNRLDDVSGLGHLAAAGVAFMVLAGLNRQLRREGESAENLPDLLRWLDLVALATVCDVVPLTGLNRAFVKKGLEVAQIGLNAGLRALCRAAGLSKPANPHHFGFVIGPRINAGGRIGAADLGARLLISLEDAEIERIAAELDTLNHARRAEEARMLEEAVAMVGGEENGAGLPPVLVAAASEWHPGIVGLIAARLREKFGKPAFAIALEPDGGRGTGSGRSVPGVDIGSAVRAAVDRGIAEKGGGHAMAAGLTLKAERLDDLAKFLNGALSGPVEALGDHDVLPVDAAATAGAVSEKMVESIEAAGPFGNGNPEPMIAFPAHFVSGPRWVGEQHLACRLRAQDGTSIKAMAFRAKDTPLGAFLETGHGPLHVAGRIGIDEWRGRREPVVHIKDAARG